MEIDPNIKQKLMVALANITPLRPACAYARITYQTYLNWIERGEKKESQEFVDFVDDINECLAKVQMTLIKKIYDGESVGFNMQWLLERRFRNEWGKEIHLKTDEKPKDAIEINVNFAGVSEFAKS